MKKKWIIFTGAFLGCCSLVCLFLLKHNPKDQRCSTHLCIKEPYFVPVNIKEFHSQIPCVDIRIQGNTTTVKVDLGFSGDLSLPETLLKQLDDKAFIRRKSHFGIRGKRYYSDVYEIPKIHIGALMLFRPKAEESNQEFEKDTILWRSASFWEFMPKIFRETLCSCKPSYYSLAKPILESVKDTIPKTADSPFSLKVPSSEDYLGRIGWPLFYNFNFFLDCDNSLLAFCDSLETLKKHGYPVDEFIEAPLLIDRNFIEFEAMTEHGLMRCILDTGCTKNILNKDIDGGNNDHMVLNPDTARQFKVLNPTNSDQMVFDLADVYDMPIFKVGKKDFGSVTFQKMKIPLEVDAIIGMDFLDSKLVFIDFPNRKIYFYEYPLEENTAELEHPAGEFNCWQAN